jgi:hypothetical protein
MMVLAVNVSERLRGFRPHFLLRTFERGQELVLCCLVS